MIGASDGTTPPGHGLRRSSFRRRWRRDYGRADGGHFSSLGTRRHSPLGVEALTPPRECASIWRALPVPSCKRCGDGAARGFARFGSEFPNSLIPGQSSLFQSFAFSVPRPREFRIPNGVVLRRNPCSRPRILARAREFPEKWGASGNLARETRGATVGAHYALRHTLTCH